MAEWLNVSAAEPYHLEGIPPKNLRPGSYQIWGHNGTGGPWGWSEPVSLEVIEGPDKQNLKTFRVDDYAAVPNDGLDDADAIEKAVRAAAQAGGGIVLFSEGTYHLSRHIDTPADAPGGIRFVGAGMGDQTGRLTRYRAVRPSCGSSRTSPYPRRSSGSSRPTAGSRK
ncbi:hypothetical protein HQ520_17860 [bacterium]|nr:hypothetical protein [bacterium]